MCGKCLGILSWHNHLMTGMVFLSCSFLSCKIGIIPLWLPHMAVMTVILEREKNKFEHYRENNTWWYMMMVISMEWRCNIFEDNPLDNSLRDWKGSIWKNDLSIMTKERTCEDWVEDVEVECHKCSYCIYRDLLHILFFKFQIIWNDRYEGFILFTDNTIFNNLFHSKNDLRTNSHTLIDKKILSSKDFTDCIF